MAGGIFIFSIILAMMFFSLLHITFIGILASFAAAFLAGLLIWIGWIRWQYSPSDGDIMNRVHHEILSHLDFDGNGRLLDVGCGSGALSIRAALTWPDAEITGIDSWGGVYAYSKTMCEKNAQSEGVGSRCNFRSGDASRLDFPDESFDAVVSNYVYHNIVGLDKHSLIMESLRVLKKGGAFALNDDMKARMYGDMEVFAQKLRDMGYQEVRIVDTAKDVFGSHRRAASMMLGSSRMIVGRK